MSTSREAPDQAEKKKSSEWWIGQAIAIYLGVATLGQYNGTAAAVVCYALSVLVDIRERAKEVGK